jgi:hypothetical protein
MQGRLDLSQRETKHERYRTPSPLKCEATDYLLRARARDLENKIEAASAGELPDFSRQICAAALQAIHGAKFTGWDDRRYARFRPRGNGAFHSVTRRSTQMSRFPSSQETPPRMPRSM